MIECRDGKFSDEREGGQNSSTHGVKILTYALHLTVDVWGLERSRHKFVYSSIKFWKLYERTNSVISVNAFRMNAVKPRDNECLELAPNHEKILSLLFQKEY